MADELQALLEQAPPRPRSAVAPHLRKAARGYRVLAMLMWSVLLGVALLVGLTSAEGEKLSTTIYGFMGMAIVIGIPTQVFATVNTRHIRECLTSGVRCPARIIQVRQRGNTGRKFEEIEVEVRDPSGETRRAFASGVTTGAGIGTEVPALLAPSRPGIVALVFGPHLAIASVA